MRSSIRILIMLSFLIASDCLLANSTEVEIKSMLDFIAEEWSEGDLDSLRGIFHRDFVQVTDDGVRNREQRFSELEIIMTTGNDHGELSYTDIEVTPLTDDKVLVYGRSSLKFKDGTELGSMFSSIYINTPFGWKAVFTHQ